MTPERWREIDALLQRALELEAPERSGFVRVEAGSDAELCREVLSLLAAAATELSALDRPMLGGAARALGLSPEEDDSLGLVGDRVGAYRLTRLLAVGGMGAVYLGERADGELVQRVAVKVVRSRVPGLGSVGSADLARRFRTERQVLADLVHPNITRLLDAGATPEGRPYVIMEYVDGRPVDAYCRERGLGVAERVLLFCAVCDAVHAAHQALVLHRDLKPQNILVTPTGQVKVLDFGLAKLMDRDSRSSEWAPTATKGFVGTLAYAAPEQVRTTPSPPDIRSDVYALGVVLYRLLTDRAPYSVDGTLSDVLRAITEDAPQAPSAVRPGLGSELDAIVMTSLSKEPSRRYPSVAALSDDLRRFLSGMPVTVKADSTLYLLRKSARRYRVPLLVAGAVLVLVSGFAIVTARQAGRLSDRSAELADALRASRIEQARLEGRSGNVFLAESMLWAERLDEEARPGDRRLAEWALRELYAEYPCVRTTHTMPLHRLERVNASRMVGLVDAGPAVLLQWPTLELAALVPTRAQPRAVAAHPEHGLMALGLADGSVVVANDAGEELYTVAVGVSGVSDVDLSPDGRRLACVCGGVGSVWRLTDGAAELEHEFRHAEPLFMMRFVPPDAGTVIAQHDLGGLCQWDVGSGELVRTYPDMSRGNHRMAISPDGAYVAWAEVQVRVSEPSTGRTILELRDGKGWAEGLEFVPKPGGGWWLAATSYDNVVRLWDLPSGRLVREQRGHGASPRIVRLTPEGDLLTLDREGLARAWSVEPDRGVRWTPRPAGTIFNLRVARGTGWVAVCADAQPPHLDVLDVATGQVRHTISGFGDTPSSLAVTPDGSMVVVSDYAHRLTAVRVRTGEHVWRSAPGPAKLSAVAMSPDGRRFAVVSNAAQLTIHDTATGEQVASSAIGPVRAPSVDWSPDGRTIAALTLPEATLVLADDEARVRGEIQLPTSAAPRVVRFSPDGRWLATGGDDAIVRLWAMPVGPGQRPALELVGHRQGLYALAFSPDGALLATAGRSGRIRLWDVRTGRQLAIIGQHEDVVFTLDFSDDGGTLISGGQGGMIGLWDLGAQDRHLAANEPFFQTYLQRTGGAAGSAAGSRAGR